MVLDCQTGASECYFQEGLRVARKIILYRFDSFYEAVLALSSEVSR
jgi:hypothetical protein